MMDSNDFIRFSGIYKTFIRKDGEEPNRVLQGLDLTVRKGETLVIIGQSGTGKSVTLRLLLGLMRPDKGSILFNKQDVCAMREAELVEVRKHFGMLFQGAALFDSLTVAENVSFGLEARGEKNPQKLRDAASEMLRAVQLPGVEDKMPSQLSGGQKKRVALARAVAMRPEVILYDEPTTGLDPITSDAINDLIIDTQKQFKVTSIVVTHDMNSAYKVADRIVMLHRGQVVGEGTPDEIRTTDNPMIQQFIHGRAQGPIQADI